MSFNDKINAIENARKEYPEFNEQFIAYLSLGHSFNGAYNHFSLEDIKKYEKTSVEEIKPVTVVEQKVTETVKPKTTKPAIALKA